MKLEETELIKILHPSGTLLSHLRSTAALLEQWQAPTPLCKAGLYHAIYGTGGFPSSLISMGLRGAVAEQLGEITERIVYLYCACDRDSVWPQFGQDKPIQFRERFSGKIIPVTEYDLTSFCELTAANEVEIAQNNPDFITRHGAELHKLFTDMKPYLSMHAIKSTDALFNQK
ncbi:MAG: hypothetical protein HUJ29_10610 [Gammaproteobacteria bacterium]|nr:hypothetical protein [Gammaproteobacteria bacterium]